MLNISDVKMEAQGDPNTFQNGMFSLYLLANLYTLSWSSLLTLEFKAVSWMITTRVEMEWAKLERKAQAKGIYRQSPV